MKIYSPKQASIELGVGLATIKRWIYSGKIQSFITPTGYHKINEEEVNKIKMNISKGSK